MKEGVEGLLCPVLNRGGWFFPALLGLAREEAEGNHLDMT